MKNRSYRYDINRPRPGHGQKYTKYKMSLSIMMAMCIKQHLNNSLDQLMKKLSNTEAELKNIVAYKKACILFKICGRWFLHGLA